MVSTIAAVAATLVSTIAAVAAALVSTIAALVAILARVTCGLRLLGLLPLRRLRALFGRLGTGLLGGGLGLLGPAGGGHRLLFLRLGRRLRRAASAAACGGDLRRLRELFDLEPLVGNLHIVDEDVRRVGRAGDLVILAPGRDRLLRAVITGLIESHRGDHLRGEAHELGGLVVR